MRLLRAEDMAVLYETVRIEWGRQTLTAFNLWRRWPKRGQYIAVGLYPPGMATPRGHLNLWAGFAVSPRPGDWSKFRSHLEQIICGGNKEVFDWLMDWLADLAQNPSKKPGTAIVLKSDAKGTGKSMLIAMLKRIFGVHGLSVSKSEHLVGRFNGHLQKAILLGVEEAFWAGHKAAAGALKNLITESEITIEHKGIIAIDAANYTRLIFTSNENWVVPAVDGTALSGAGGS
jgi:hypothetical protein